jgi:ABC-type amino acid transport substrate-binding protein
LNDAQKCPDAGTNGHFVKPVDPETQYPGAGRATLQRRMGKKRMRNNTLKAGLLSVVLFILLAFSAASPASAADGAKRVIRAAVYNNSNLAYQDNDGVWRGSDVECLINIAQRAGFSVEFIDSANDPDFLSNLDNGVYDVVCDVVKTPEREANYLFSDTALGTMNNILTVRADDDRWEFGNIEQISSMKVGILRTYANNEEFRSWCSLRGVTPSIVEYDDYEEMTAALKKGDIDSILYSLMYGTDYTKNFRTVLQLLPETYYFAFRESDTALKNAVDEALSQIIMENPDYLMNLNNRYIKQFGQSNLPFSASEKEYIAQHPTVSVAVLESDEPYFAHGADGAARGVIPDYYALLSRLFRAEFPLCRLSDAGCGRSRRERRRDGCPRHLQQRDHRRRSGRTHADGKNHHGEQCPAHEGRRINHGCCDCLGKRTRGGRLGEYGRRYSFRRRIQHTRNGADVFSDAEKRQDGRGRFGNAQRNMAVEPDEFLAVQRNGSSRHVAGSLQCGAGGQ